MKGGSVDRQRRVTTRGTEEQALRVEFAIVLLCNVLFWVSVGGIKIHSGKFLRHIF